MGILGERRKYSDKRLEAVRERVASLRSVKCDQVAESLCIYATGSYARKEASKHSDLDLFFVSVAEVDRIRQTLVKADLIRLIEELEFPPFSGDGRWLEVHSLESVLEDLGSPVDDYRNFFTARLLFLLESTPVFNESVYDEVLDRIIASYYRDFHDHAGEFLPIFLANDVMRFWKTLCLNYEHKRNYPYEEDEDKKKAHLKNFKLKFSRLLTCFSTLLALSKEDETNNPGLEQEELKDLVRMSPFERIREVSRNVGGTERLVEFLEEKYSWFLEKTGLPKPEQLDWICDEKNRREAFTNAKEFGDKMYELLKAVSSDQIFRFLVV